MNTELQEFWDKWAQSCNEAFLSLAVKPPWLQVPALARAAPSLQCQSSQAAGSPSCSLITPFPTTQPTPSKTISNTRGSQVQGFLAVLKPHCSQAKASPAAQGLSFQTSINCSWGMQGLYSHWLTVNQLDDLISATHVEFHEVINEKVQEWFLIFREQKTWINQPFQGFCPAWAEQTRQHSQVS